MTTEEPKVSLAPATTDYVTSAAKAVLGAVPFAGSLLAEIAGTIIPNQRIDRIARFAAELENRLGRLEQAVVREKLREETFTDLAEEALRQAARAVSDERLCQIADVVANSISDEHLSSIEAKHLLSTLGELNDIEVVRLGYYAEMERTTWGERTEFYEKHEALLVPVHAHMGSSQETFDKDTFQKSYDEHLARLGLLEAKYRLNRDNEPELDRFSGAPKIDRYGITSFGRLLSRRIGLFDKGA